MKIKKTLLYYLAFVLIFFFIFYSILFLKFPFKSTEDVWHYLAAIHELKKDFNQINDPLFIEGPRDIHYSPYFLMAAIFSTATNLEVVDTYILFSFLNTLFLIYALYFLYKSLNDNLNKPLNAYLFVFLCLLTWGPSTLSYSGYFSISDLILNGAAPANFALACTLFVLGNLSKKPTYNLKRYLLLYTFSVLTFMAHILTGVMLSLIILAYLLFTLIKEKKLTLNIFIIGAIPPLSLAITSLWPYYSVLDFLFNKASVTSVEENFIPLSMTDWISVGGLGVIGIFILLRQKFSYLHIWVFGYSSILLSYYTPLQVSLYWRFFPLFIIPGYIGLVDNLRNNTRSSSFPRIILIIFILFGIISFGTKYSYRAGWQSITQENWSFIKTLEVNDVLLSDPHTSYYIAGLYGVNIVVTREGHMNPSNEVEASERLQKVNEFLHGDKSQEQLFKLISDYKVTYLLVNRNLDYMYSWETDIFKIGNYYPTVFSNDEYEVYKIKNL